MNDTDKKLTVDPMSWAAFQSARGCVFNLSGGLLALTAVANGDYYEPYVSNKHGRKPTKAQILWASTVAQTTAYHVR